MPKMPKNKLVVIIGAGITGLVAGYYLSENYRVIVLEKENFLGGTATNFEYKGFNLDYGPHKLYTELPEIMEEIGKVVPLIKIKKKNSIYLQNNYYDFPLKMSQVAVRMPLTAFKVGIDILCNPFSKKPDDSYENYLANRFGKTLYGLSFKDYAKKVWGSDPKNLDAELAKRRIAISGIFGLIKSVIFKDTKNISADYFYYPEKGTQQIFQNLADGIKANGGLVLMNERIEEIDINNDRINFIRTKNQTLKPDYIISTMPLNSLSGLLRPHIDVDLTYQNLNIVYFVLNKPKALNDCWIFFPEDKFIFQRVSEQKAFSENTSPKDKTVIMVETTKNVTGDDADTKDTINLMIEQLEKVGILSRTEIDEYFVKSIKEAYPVYKKGFSESLNKFVNAAEKVNNFYLLGRQGLFNYNNMDQCWDMALKINEHITNDKTKAEWQATKQYFDKYRIVD